MEQLEPLAIPAAEEVTLENLSFAYGDTTVFSGPSDLHSSNSGIFIIFVIQLISTRTDLLSIYSYGY